MQLPSSLWIDARAIALVQGDLFDEERALLTGATRVRQREIIAGRVLAHRLMERAGYDAAPVMRHGSGAPVWPKGICGSISHSAYIVAVVLAGVSNMQSVGVDIEDERDLGIATAEVADDDELRDAIHHPLAGDEAAAARLLFSAKEAVFKCQATLTGNVDLAFDQIRLRLGPRGFLGVPVQGVDPQIAHLVRRMHIIVEYFQGVRLALAWLDSR